MGARVDAEKQREAAALPDPGGLLCLRRGDRFFRYVRPAPLGSLVQRELAAVRLTEGWIRAFLHCGRYLQPLRHGAERRATSPYTGGGIAERRYFLLAATVPCGAAFPAAAVPFGDAKFHPGRVFPPLGPPAAQKPGEKPDRHPFGRRISRHRPFTPRKRKTPLPERTNRQGRFHRRNGVGKRNYHVAWGRNCAPVSGRRGSCAVTKIPACYLTVPII